MSKKNYSLKGIRYWYSYSIDEIAILYSIHPQTVSKWLRLGLKSIDKKKPHLIYGYELKDYLGKQNKKGKFKTAIDEMFCFTCQDIRKPYKNTVEPEQRGYFVNLKSICPECKKPMNKTCNLELFSEIKKIFAVGVVSQLYDSLNPSYKTQLLHQDKMPISEPSLLELMNRE